MPSILKLNNRLPDIASLIRFGSSITKKEGDIVSKIYEMVWPKNKPHLWSTLREEIESLTSKKANKLKEQEIVYEFLQHAFEKINQAISECEYEKAGKLLMAMTLDSDDSKTLFDNMDINHSLEYVPLLIVIVNLKIALFLEAIKYTELFEMPDYYTDIFKIGLKVEVRGVKEYIAQCYEELLIKYGQNNESYFKFSYYYGVTTGVFTSLWLQEYDDYLVDSLSEFYYIPAVVAGTFYKLVNIDGKLNAEFMTPREIAKNSMMPSSNLLETLYQEPQKHPKGYINTIYVYVNLEDKYKTTGIDLIYTNPDETFEMGMTTNNTITHLWLVTFKLMLIANQAEFFNKVSIASDNFITGLMLSTNQNNTLKTDPNFNHATAQEISIINPFTINAMYVPSGKAGELRSTNHQMAGIAMSVIFNEVLAKEYVRELYE